MSKYNIVSDKHAAGVWNVMKVGSTFVLCSCDSYAAAKQAVRIAEGSTESWSNGKEYQRDDAGRIILAD